MSRIDDLIAEHCPDGVEHRPMGAVGTFIRGNGLQKADLKESGFPAIHYGQIHTRYGVWTDQTISFVTDEFAAKLRRAQPGDVVLATTSEDDEAVGKATAWVGETEVAVSGDAFIYRHTLDPKYISYFLSSESFQDQKTRSLTGTKVRRISGDALARIIIPVPPIEVQREIVRILDTFTQLEAELEAELEARRIQYAHYRSALLSRSSSRVAAMGEVLDMKAGKFIKANEISSNKLGTTVVPCYGGNGIRGYVTEASHSGTHSLIGRQGALCGNVQRVSGDFYATEHAVVVTPKEPMDESWLYHLLDTMNLNQYATKSAQPGLSVKRLEQVPIEIPPKSEQDRIGEILDNFDALTNDLSIGLPAELEARRKQYAYYRDKLLTFKELPA